MGRHRVACDHLAVGRGGTIQVDGLHPLPHRTGKTGRTPHGARFAGVSIANAQQRLVALGVEREGVNHGLEPGDGSGEIFAAQIVEADLGLPFP